MTITDETEFAELAELAAEFPAWQVWRSRDGRGRDSGWNATGRGKPGPAALAAGMLGKVTAGGPAQLRAQLEQQHTVETGKRHETR